MPIGQPIDALTVSYAQLEHLNCLNDLGGQCGSLLSGSPLASHPIINPQELNRYSYCLNNPLKYDDPTGNQDIVSDSAYAVSIVALVYYSWLAVTSCQPISGKISLPSNPDISIDVKGEPVWTMSDIQGTAIGYGADSVVYITNDSDNTTPANPNSDGTTPANPNPKDPLGKGSSVHKAGEHSNPLNDNEQNVLDKVKAHPGIGTDVDLNQPMGDKRWPSKQGWVKKEVSENGITFHYVYNVNTGEWDDPKFK